MMETKFYTAPICEYLEVDQPAVLCTSSERGASTSPYDGLGNIDLN